jgi:hypothetical protein
MSLIGWGRTRRYSGLFKGKCKLILSCFQTKEVIQTNKFFSSRLIDERDSEQFSIRAGYGINNMYRSDGVATRYYGHLSRESKPEISVVFKYAH